MNTSLRILIGWLAVSLGIVLMVIGYGPWVLLGAVLLDLLLRRVVHPRIPMHWMSGRWIRCQHPVPAAVGEPGRWPDKQPRQRWTGKHSTSASGALKPFEGIAVPCQTLPRHIASWRTSDLRLGGIRGPRKAATATPSPTGATAFSTALASARTRQLLSERTALPLPPSGSLTMPGRRRCIIWLFCC